VSKRWDCCSHQTPKTNWFGWSPGAAIAKCLLLPASVPLSTRKTTVFETASHRISTSCVWVHPAILQLSHACLPKFKFFAVLLKFYWQASAAPLRTWSGPVFLGSPSVFSFALLRLNPDRLIVRQDCLYQNLNSRSHRCFDCESWKAICHGCGQ
jgi:hypothetical protein